MGMWTEELSDLRWAGHVARMGEERGAYRVLVGKPEGKRIWLAQDRDRWRPLVSTVRKLWVPQNAGNFLTSCKPASFSRRTLHHGVSK